MFTVLTNGLFELTLRNLNLIISMIGPIESTFSKILKNFIFSIVLIMESTYLYVTSYFNETNCIYKTLQFLQLNAIFLSIFSIY